MGVERLIKARRSIRKFKSSKPDWREIIECIDSTRYAPMAGNNFSLKFILVEDGEKIQKLAEAAQQNFITKAKYVIVVCTTPGRTETAYGERGSKYLKQQAGAAIQNLLLKLTECKLATCWVGHFVDEQVKDILDIPDEIDVEAMFPIGYPYEKPKEKRYIELDSILYFNRYGNKRMEEESKLSA
ncbi:MAG: nitroreductase A [Candidatus Diapherotrites archaeon ADurb.Bin253]|jgi:nitroreductase|nr:MAG: nitroreductase A [Candidatus Diapherotrites archaeon ADurb.Bin253]HNZ52181.1 nitroreductase family protein [Candidatus Pacearchaeota archaeon]HOC96734.1 nitroreductase family protein [Candidatus Pacearchaeota archaeon]HOH04294.1 nitroreductase family protein [Candidatus Pacearchaeota archaeon]HPX74522.1 nitroreductase family protein [Candidatus Pacearchaeota archaeon]